MSDFDAPNSISAGAPSQTPLGELTALPQAPLLDLGGLLLKGEGKGGESSTPKVLLKWRHCFMFGQNKVKYASPSQMWVG